MAINKKIKVSKIDQFGIAAGIIGLIADFSSLSALFSGSSNEGTPSLFGWIAIFVLILYSTMIVNFFIRRSILRRMNRQASTILDSKMKEIEGSILGLTLLVCLPVMTVYFVAALFQYNSFDSSLLDWYEFLLRSYSLADGFYILICGVFYGSILSWTIIGTCHLLLKNFYRGLAPEKKI